MQPEELRIGNVIQYFNGEKWINDILDAKNLCNYIPASYRGISLNYEILERSGFTGTAEKNIFTSDSLPINMEFYYNGTFASPYIATRLIKEEGLDPFRYVVSKKCRFVHELQNLILSLTDKEWEVKL